METKEDWRIKNQDYGCINADVRHHIGLFGILGVGRKAEEPYQIALGGSADEGMAIGKIVGHGLSEEDDVDAVEKGGQYILDIRSNDNEPFLCTYQRVGDEPFKHAHYGDAGFRYLKFRLSQHFGALAELHNSEYPCIPSP